VNKKYIYIYCKYFKYIIFIQKKKKNIIIKILQEKTRKKCVVKQSNKQTNKKKTIWSPSKVRKYYLKIIIKNKTNKNNPQKIL